MMGELGSTRGTSLRPGYVRYSSFSPAWQSFLAKAVWTGGRMGESAWPWAMNVGLWVTRPGTFRASRAPQRARPSSSRCVGQTGGSQRRLMSSDATS